MKVRGAALVVLPSFLVTNFGSEAYNKWLAALPEESKKLFRSGIDQDEWYPIHEGMHHPTEVLCNLFYRGKLQGAWELGRFSADYGMNNLMRIFVKVAKVTFILKKATSILTSYYEPCRAEIVESSSHSATIRIVDFSEMTTIIENRIAGYMERAAELTGGRNVNVFIGPSLTKAHPYTEFKVQWK